MNRLEKRALSGSSLALSGVLLNIYFNSTLECVSFGTGGFYCPPLSGWKIALYVSLIVIGAIITLSSFLKIEVRDEWK